MLRPQFVAIYPDYAYVDGCVDVTLTGHKLGTEATATIGGEPLPLTPAKEEPGVEPHAQDVGFEYYAQVPPAPSGAPGWVDVTMTVDGKELTLKDGFYYRSCPGTFAADVFVGPEDPDPYTLGTPLAAGDTISLQGCGLDQEVMIEFVNPTVVSARLAPPPTTTGTTTGTTDSGTPTDTGTTGGTTTAPTGDTGGTTTVPTGDTGGTTTIPTGDTGTPTVIPTGDTGTVPTGTGDTGTVTATTCLCEGTVVQQVPLVSDCSTARAHVQVPTLPDGAYCIRAVHPDGTQAVLQDHSSYDYYGYCYSAAIFTVGGAR